jgi:hypothetical protein
MTVSVDGAGLVRLADVQADVRAWSDLLTLAGDEDVTVPVHTRREVMGTSDQPLPLVMPDTAPAGA